MKAIFPYRIIFIVLVALGAFLKLEAIWVLADIVNGLMAIPNLIGVIVLCSLVRQITKNYLDRRLHGKNIKPMLSAFPDIQAEQEKALAEAED